MWKLRFRELGWLAPGKYLRSSPLGSKFIGIIFDHLSVLKKSVPGNSLIIDYQNRFNFMHTFGHFDFKPKISAAITNLFFFFFQIHFLVSPEKPREKKSFVFFAVFSKSHQGIFMKSGAAEWFCLLSIMQTSLSVEEEKGRFLCFPELFLPLISEFRETSVLLLVV